MRSKSLRGSALLALILVPGGCKDGTGSTTTEAPAAQVAIRASTGEYEWERHNGREMLVCAVSLVATVAGGQNATATWDRAVLRQHAGPQDAVVDSLVLTAAEVAASWGSGTVAVGQTLESRQRLRSHVPFSISAEYHYGTGHVSSKHTARWGANCGPTLPPEATAPPLLTASLATPRADVATGDTLVITYTAASTAGLQEIVVAVAGTLDTQIRFPKLWLTSTTDTVRIPIPPLVLLGEPVRVTVHAVDVVGQVTSHPLSPTAPVRDGIVPRLTQPIVEGAADESWRTLRGSLPAGDELVLRVSASDEYGLTAVVAELQTPAGTVRDSVPLSGTTLTGHRIRLSAPAQWPETSGQLRIRVWDANGNGNEVTSEAGAIRVYPTSVRPMHTATLRSWVGSAVLSPDGGRAYLSLLSNRLVAVSLPTLAEAGSVYLHGASHVDLTRDGDTLLVLQSDERVLVVVDAARMVITARIVLETGGRRPAGVAVAANGRVLIPLTAASGAGAVLEVDPARGTQRIRSEGVGGGNWVGGTGWSLDRRRVALYTGSCGLIYDVETDSFTPCSTVNEVGSFSGDATGRHFVSSEMIYDEALRPVRSWSSIMEFHTSRFAAMDPAGAYAWIHTSRGLVRVRVADGAYVERTRVPLASGPILFPPGREFLLTAGNVDGVMETRLTWVDMR